MSRRRGVGAPMSASPASNATNNRRMVTMLALISSYLVLSGIPLGLAFQGSYKVKPYHVPRSTVTSLSRISPLDDTASKMKRSSHYSSLTWPQGTAEDTSWEDVLNPTAYPTPDHEGINSFDKAVLGGSISIATAALFVLIGLSDPGSWRYFLAGGICAATSHAVPVPIDVVKVSQDRSLA